MKSFKGLKWETLSFSSYFTLIGISFIRTSFHAIRTITSISNSNFVVKNLIPLILFNGYNRNPVWVSESEIPVSAQNQKFENLFPKLLFLGIPTWSISLAPTMIESGCFAMASINKLISAG